MFEKIGDNTKEQEFSGEKDILAKTKIEITELRNRALQAQAEGQNYNPNLIDSNPDIIAEEDARMWQRIKNLKTVKDIQKLKELFKVEKNKIFSQEIEQEIKNESDWLSRKDFWDFMANKMMSKFYEIYQIDEAQKILKNLQKIASENKDSEEARNPNLKFIDLSLINKQEAELLDKAENIKLMEDYNEFKEEYDSVLFPEETNGHSHNFMQFIANRAGGKLAEVLKKEKQP